MLTSMDYWVDGILERQEPLIQLNIGDEVLTVPQHAQMLADQAKAQALALS
jgi:hypothetical protein